MKDKEMFLNWIKAWAFSIAVNAAVFAGLFWFYGDALLRHGLLEGGAL